MEKPIAILKGVTRVPGTVEGEALVTTEKLSHLANAVSSQGVVRMHGHPLQGQSYAGKVIVYDTDKYSTGGAWALYFKAKITKKGPLGLVCRTVHPISVGGAVDAGLPAVDGFDQDPCRAIHSGDRVRITAPAAGEPALLEVFAAEPRPAPELPRTAPAPGWNRKDLVLAPREAEMLAGKHGRAVQLAMERLVAFGEAMGAKRMVRIVSAHLFDDNRSEDLTIGAWPIFEEFARLGARVAVPTTVESTILGEDLIDDPGMPWNFRCAVPARRALELMRPVHEWLTALGAQVLPTCIPYAHLAPPKFGEYLVTSESNAAAYSNIMLGARVNRDPANLVLYAALTGVMPEYGMHLDENRKGSMIFEVDPEVASSIEAVGEFVALGGAIGMRAVDRTPVVTGLGRLTNAQAKAFCACVSPALLYPMIHLVGVTPEARTLEEAFGGRVPEGVERIRVGRKEIDELFAGIRQTEKREIDAAVIGCPFLMFEEMLELAKMLEGKTVKARLWLYTDYVVYAAAKQAGILARIEKSGARVVHSACPGMVMRAPADAEQLVFATDSLKVAMLMSGIGWPRNWLGTRREVVNAALTGRFERGRG